MFILRPGCAVAHGPGTALGECILLEQNCASRKCLGLLVSIQFLRWILNRYARTHGQFNLGLLEIYLRPFYSLKALGKAWFGSFRWLVPLQSPPLLAT